jgi:hypothetical protein
MKELLKYKNIIVAAVIVIFFLILFRMTYSSYSRRMQKLDRELKEIQKKEKLIKDAIKFNKEVKKLKSKFFEGNILDAKSIIEEIAAKNNVVINLVKPQFRGEEGEYALVDLSLNVEAEYRDLISFLRTLEQRYFLQIKTVSEQRGEEYKLLIKLFLAQ